MRLDSICKIKIDSSDYKSVDSLKIIDSVKNEYIIGDVIDFNYVNPTKTPLYVGISLERKDDEDWFLFFNEIFKKHSFLVHPDNGVIHIMPEGGFSINTFSPIKGTKKDCWKVCDCLYGDESIALFRLKYTISLIPYGFEFSNKNVVLPTKVCYSKPLLSGIFMQLCKTIKKRQLAHVFVYRIGHVDFAEQFRQWYLL